jgi:glucose/arabinose dehydrogenase
LLKLELVAEIDGPVDAVERPGEEVVYLVARRGFVHRLRDSRLDEDPAFDVSDLTVAEGERGLLGLAFSPDGATAYLNYTDLDGHTVIATVLVDDAGAFNRETLQTLLKIEQPYANHNGGDIVVEPSGMLLVATGDGGSGGDPRRLALDVSSLHGKVLRIDPRTGEVTVLARGLRNPWRIDLHDDRLWLADVGQSQWEEVNVLEGVSTIVRPRDFGWSAYEGTEPFNEDQSSPEHLPPVLVYEHGDDGCSISGGAVAESGLLAGRYVFADYCSGRVWSIPTNVTGPSKELLFIGIESPVAVVRAGGVLFVLTLGGTVWRIVG